MENKFFILSQPEHAVLSIIIANLPGNKELPEDTHNLLDLLAENTDLFFIFPKSDRKSNKFTSLYRGCGYTELEENSIQQTLLQTLEYDKEIFQTHTAVVVSNLSDLNIDSLDKLICDKIIKVAASDVCKPVFSRKRLESSEFWKIYKNNEEKRGLFSKQVTKEDTKNMYTSYTTLSPIVFLKPQQIKIMIDFNKSPEGYSKVETFDNDDFRYFLASYISLLGLDFINTDLKDLKYE